MYLRTDHAETDIRTLHQFIYDNPLGVLTTAIPSATKIYPMIQSSHIPWILDFSDESSTTGLGMLRGHMARANPQSKAIVESLTQTNPNEATNVVGDGNVEFLEDEVLVLFNGPAHSYVTPKFYTETKPSTGKVVPTWNYAAVQVYGKAKIYHSAKASSTSEYLQKQINDLTNLGEAQMLRSMGSEDEKPWTLDEAPKNYVDLLRKAIIGVEIEITRLEGKFKMSQERPLGDREGILNGFRRLEDGIGKKMAEMVEDRGRLRDEEIKTKQESSAS